MHATAKYLMGGLVIYFFVNVALYLAGLPTARQVADEVFEPRGERMQEERRQQGQGARGQASPELARVPVEQNLHDLPKSDYLDSEPRYRSMKGMYTGESWPNLETSDELVDTWRTGSQRSSSRPISSDRSELDSEPDNRSRMPASLYSGTSWPDTDYYEKPLPKNSDPNVETD